MPERKPSKQKTAAGKKTKVPKPIGKVTHYFGEISVAIVKFNKKVPLGAHLHFKGATTDFKDAIGSMQYDHKPVEGAEKNQEVGIKVKKRARDGDAVYEAE